MRSNRSSVVIGGGFFSAGCVASLGLIVSLCGGQAAAPLNPPAFARRKYSSSPASDRELHERGARALRGLAPVALVLSALAWLAWWGCKWRNCGAFFRFRPRPGLFYWGRMSGRSNASSRAAASRLLANATSVASRRDSGSLRMTLTLAVLANRASA